MTDIIKKGGYETSEEPLLFSTYHDFWVAVQDKWSEYLEVIGARERKMETPVKSPVYRDANAFGSIARTSFADEENVMVPSPAYSEDHIIVPRDVAERLVVLGSP